ncbi:hypothetical protein HSB1_42530 [Halogranum salarium B-1]|uniref:DUF7995 domain-containing protein n=1 Tax=Halogranum salarium B-1 TaxID=1210908 RepID=J2Z9I1_9EURY|nr:hypothetical protein HSB1_42530 [Halogranum salarium B-1]
MHQLIYALVEAPNRDDALASGNAAFDRLVGAGPDTAAVFDYYVTFDDETTSVAGKARWGELPVVAPVDSDEGLELLERGWNATIEEFERNLERVRTAVEEFTTEALMRDKELARTPATTSGHTVARRSSCTMSTAGRFAIATN